MAITSITRDWGIVPCIVRIVSTDSLAVVGTAGYLTAQLANTTLANNGVFEWLVSDSVLVYASNGSAFYTVSPDFSSLVALTGLQNGVLNAVTALAGGGQVGATPLTAAINRVTVVATAADSVLLPHAVPGLEVIVINATATSMNVYPQSGEQINEAGANVPLAQAGHVTSLYVCAALGLWDALVGS